MPCLSISDQQYCIWVFLDQNFKQNSCHIWNQHPWIGVIAKYHEIMKIPKFGTKSASLGYFWGRIAKTYCHIWNQHPQICLFAKFQGRTKMPKFGTKNAWFGYFWAGIWKQYCHIWNQHPQICLIAKFCENTKRAKFGTKNNLFGYFFGYKLKKLLSYLESAPSNLSKMSL